MVADVEVDVLVGRLLRCLWNSLRLTWEVVGSGARDVVDFVAMVFGVWIINGWNTDVCY